jgi:hypothetical protein
MLTPSPGAIRKRKNAAYYALIIEGLLVKSFQPKDSAPHNLTIN